MISIVATVAHIIPEGHAGALINFCSCLSPTATVVEYWHLFVGTV
jgi:hypothetical protein